MDEFNSHRKYPKTLKLKDLNPGKYDLTSLRKVSTKFGNFVMVKLDDEEPWLAKKHGELSDEAIKFIKETIKLIILDSLIENMDRR